MLRQLLAAAAIAGLAAPAVAQHQGHDMSAAHHASPEAHAAHHRELLTAAAADMRRSEANRARDMYRNPVETLMFFGVEPHDSVVELWPGGGWYTEILSPYLSVGTLHVVPATGNSERGIRAKLESDPGYAGVKVATFDGSRAAGVADASADVVLTFRNVHNWMMGEAPIADAVFAEAYRMLKPGGTLGIVEHRLPEEAEAERERTSGYVKTSTVRALAEKAGFRFIEASEVNANPRDTADWEKGVWTLPPTYAMKDVDRARYAAIGESDRMTLKFVKPE